MLSKHGWFISVSKKLMKNKVNTDLLWESPVALCVTLEVWWPSDPLKSNGRSWTVRWNSYHALYLLLQCCNGVLSHYVVTSSAFHYCKCLRIVEYNVDWYSAILTDDQPFLITVRRSVIFGISLNPEVKSNDAMVPVSGIQNGYDVEFDDKEEFIYWVENPVSFE